MLKCHYINILNIYPIIYSSSDYFYVFIVEQVGLHEAIICVLASQIANLGESIIGAALQEKEGFQWVGS